MVDHGLPHDLREIEQRLASRRQLLGCFASAAAAHVLGCDGLAPIPSIADAAAGAPAFGGNDQDASTDAPVDGGTSDGGGSADGTAGSAQGDSSTPTPASCTGTPPETGGPFPADSTIGPNVLVRNGIVRSDIRSSFAVGSATAQGVELEITLAVLDANCRPRPGAVVYLWHCDRDGRYSLYSPGATDQDYLRGAQQADAQGNVTFLTVFPGCYPGRWPHMHFEVFRDLATATTAGSIPLLTSQLAFSSVDCQAAYAAAGYESSQQYLQQLSLEADGVFRDGSAQQVVTLIGSVAMGFSGTLSIVV
jgi:protocatechuate 3,4-dioxygenase beta subunit